MKRHQIIRFIAERTGLEQRAVAKVLENFLEEIEKDLLDRKPVQLRPLGTLVVKTRKAKVARNPYANVELLVPEHLTVCFRPGRKLKSRLNRKSG